MCRQFVLSDDVEHGPDTSHDMLAASVCVCVFVWRRPFEGLLPSVRTRSAEERVKLEYIRSESDNTHQTSRT